MPVLLEVYYRLGSLFTSLCPLRPPLPVSVCLRAMAPVVIPLDWVCPAACMPWRENATYDRMVPSAERQNVTPALKNRFRHRHNAKHNTAFLYNIGRAGRK